MAKKKGNPPTRKQAFPIDLSNPNITSNHNTRARNLRKGYSRYNGNGSNSTVLMGQQDNFAYPMLFPRNDYPSTNPKDWLEFEDHDKARRYAANRGELFELGSEAEARSFAEGAWKNVPTKKAIALKQYGGPVGGLGILSATPSLQMGQRGMNPASLAFPSSGFVTNTSGNHLRDKRGVGGNITNYSKGGYLPNKTLGGFLKENSSGVGAAAGMGAGLLSMFPTKEGQSGEGKAAAAGALGGIGAGASFGPIGMAAGAVIGGLTGWLGKRKDNKLQAEQDEQVENSSRSMMRMAKLNQDTSALGTFPTDGIQGVNNFYTELGGFPAAEYEAEDGEVVTYAEGGPVAFNGALDNVASNMAVIDGNSHAQGGVDMAGGEFIYSKKSKSTKELGQDLKSMIGYTPTDRSYAGIAESIGKKKGNLEEKLDSHDPIAIKTAEVMMERYDEALNLVASEQEYRKTKRA